MNLNREQFLGAVEQGKVLLAELKKDYPELSLKPVFSRFGPRSGQCDMTTDLRKIVMGFPGMLAGECIHRALERSEKIILHSKIVTNGNDSRTQRAQNLDAVSSPRSLSSEGEFLSYKEYQNSQRWNETSRRRSPSCGGQAGRVHKDGELTESLRAKWIVGRTPPVFWRACVYAPPELCFVS